MNISDAECENAGERMCQSMDASPRAVAARYDRRTARIVVTLTSGLELAVPSHLLEGLADASPDDLAVIDITPTGMGLHWPKLDADFYLPALLQGVLGPASWMAKLFGQRGGSARTPAKASAARRNGRKGGRPRKQAATSD